MVVAEEYGGGLDSHACAMAVIEIARASGGLATSSRHTPPSSVDCSKRRARRPSARRL
jgi:alkylation response protein AidB-like acyl-CoA dehydrogenase